MLGKLREKLCCGYKEEGSDDTENFRPVNLPQKGKHRFESEHDGVDADVSPSDNQHSKETSLEKDGKFDDPELGPRALDELKNDCKQDSAETAKCPVSEATPADEKVIDRSDKSGTTDLWQRAFDELSEALRGRLRENEAISPENAIEEVINSTKVSFEAYQNGGLKFKKYDGKEVNVRDVARKILKSAIQCSDIIKDIAAFDPSNHASSAWGIVSLGLTMAKNSVDQKEAAFRSSEFLADILARYVILDGYCRTKKLPSSVGLDDAIAKVYKAILEYTAEVKKRQNARVLNRIGNSVFPLSDTELNNLLSTVHDQDQKVSNWSQINHYIYQSTKGDEILASIEKVHQDTEIIKAKVNLDQQHKILTWLSDIQYSYTQNDHQRVRTENTGDWLLSSDEYRKWKATPGKTLWLYGPTGCGKSILCSTVIQDLENDCSNDPSSIFSYWYFQFNRNETRNVKNMTRSIIRQLVPEEFPRLLVNLWKEHGRQNRDPDQDKFLTVLDDVINSHTGDHVFLIFDALDECPDNEAYERNLLFQVLKDLIDKHGKKIHLLATSRYEGNIRCHLEESLKIDLEDRMNDDIEAFVRDALDHGKLSRWKKVKGVNDQILAKLLDTKEPRRFRWADLQIKRLEKCKTKDQITESLETIPKTLEETYRRILQGIPEDEQEYARTILTWLSFSLVPLKLETVAAVVGFPHPEDVVETCTTSLVTVSPSTGTIKLAHFSVKEFLVVSHPKHWYQLSTIGGHMDIANRALDYLFDRTELLTKTPGHGLQLLQYAAVHWDGHLSELTHYGAKFADLDKKIYRLFEERIVYLNWRRVARDNFEPRSWYTDRDVVEPPIYLACKMGMQSVVERLLSQGANPCATFGTVYTVYRYDRSTFEAAARRGDLTIIKQLVGNIEISVKIASDIVRSIDLNRAPLEDFKAFLNILLSTEDLFDKPANGCILLKEDFVEAVAMNNDSGHQLMCLLLDRQDKLEIPINERILEAVVKNLGCGDEAMRILWERRQKDIQITEPLLLMIAHRSRFNPRIATLVIHYPKTTVPLNQNIITSFVRNAPVEVMELLLQVRGDEIQITEGLLVTAAGGWDNAAKLPLLWERKLDTIEITSIILQGIAFRRKGLECMEFLLEKCDQGYFLDHEILHRVAKSPFGLPLMRILLDKREAGLVVFDISEAILIAAASNPECPRQMMELVINNADSELLINEEILYSAVDNSREGESALKYLLELDQNLPVTEKVLLSAAAYGDYKVFELLFETFPDAPVTDRVFKAAGERSGLLLSLWLKRGCHVQDCQVIKSLLKQDILNLEKLVRLLDRGLLQFDDNLVDVVGPQKALVMAFHRRYAMEKLLDSRRHGVTVPEEVVLQALDEIRVDDKAFELLIDRLGPAVPVTEKILEKAFLKDQSRLVNLLLDEGRNWNLQKCWDTIWRSDECKLKCIMRGANALLNYGEFDISQALLEFIPRQYDFTDEDVDELANLCAERDISAPATEKLTEILFERGDAINIEGFINRLGSSVPMTENIWDALWQNDECSFKHKVILSNILLQYGEFDVSQILLEFVPPQYEDGFNDDEFYELVDLCTRRDISAPAIDMFSKILFDIGSAYTVKRFIKHKPTLRLTDDLLERAEKNRQADKKGLMPFLYSKRAADQNIKVDETKKEAEGGYPMSF